MQKTIIDISWPLVEGMTTYKNRPDFKIVVKKDWNEHHVRESELIIHSHVGTHIDAPAHFLEHGLMIESYKLDVLCGPVTVFDLTDVADSITKHHLIRFGKLPQRILFKTRNSFLPDTSPFDPNFVYLAQSAADYIAEQDVELVGIDYLGIERNQPGHETHSTLLRQNIVVVEGCRLQQVNPGTYELLCLPLAVQGVEAAPARAILIQQK